MEVQQPEAKAPSPCVEVLSETFLGPTSGNSRVVRLLDVDGDGALDAFIGAYDQADGLYWNDGAGQLILQPAGSVGSDTGLTFGAAAADLDGDGLVDLLVVHSDGGTNDLHRNLGQRRGFEIIAAGSLTEPTQDSYEAACADLDLDGDQDVVVANRGAPNELHINDGRAEFSAVVDDPLSSDLGNSRDVICGDLDGDGDDDVVIANWGANAHAVYINQGRSQGGQAARFAQDRSSELGRASSSSVSLDLGDLDGDGDLDLAFSNRKGEANEVWINEGSGRFTLSARALPEEDGGNSTDVAMVDLNGDGERDLLILNRGAPPSLYLNDGSAQFTACTGVPLADTFLAATACAFGDLRGDGGLDLLLVDAAGPDLQVRIGR